MLGLAQYFTKEDVLNIALVTQHLCHKNFCGYANILLCIALKIRNKVNKILKQQNKLGGQCIQFQLFSFLFFFQAPEYFFALFNFANVHIHNVVSTLINVVKTRLKTSSRRLYQEECLLIQICNIQISPLLCLQDVSKMSSRHMSSGRLQDMSSGRLQDICNNFSSSKTFSRRLAKCLQDAFKTSLQHVFNTSWETKNCYTENLLMMSSRHFLKVFSRRLQDQQLFTGIEFTLEKENDK